MTTPNTTETPRDHIMRQIAQIPALPASSVRLMPLLQNPDTPVNSITEVIETDPSLAANVLKLANSAMFGARGSVDSVRAAVIRLGRQQLCGMVASVSVGPHVQGEVAGYELAPGDLWQHDIAVALACEALESVLRITAPPGAMAAGLLVDIGKGVLGRFLAVDREAILSAAFEGGLSFEEAERNVLGIDHAEVGATLLDHWRLPQSIVQPVRWHHDPASCPPEYQPAADLVHAADQICTLAGVGGGRDGTQYRPCEAALQRLGVSIDIVTEVLTRIGVRLEAAVTAYTA